MSLTDATPAWTGEFRKPRNSAAEVKGSIHDDATASKLGFKGGTVAGSIWYMDQFVPSASWKSTVGGDSLARDGPGRSRSTSRRRPWIQRSGPRHYRTRWTSHARHDTMHNEAGARICEGIARPFSALIFTLRAGASVRKPRRPQNPTPCASSRRWPWATQTPLPVRIEPEGLAAYRGRMHRRSPPTEAQTSYRRRRSSTWPP